MIHDNTIKAVQLPDGRNLCYSEYGDLAGKPIIYFHGFPGSRLEVKRFHNIAESNHYRLIAVDRAGMGLSSIDKNRSILSTIDDITSLANYLKLEKFSVLSHSGGAPFVAASTYKIPQRLNAAAIVSGMAPFANQASHVGMTREQLIACKLVTLFPSFAFLMMRITRMILTKSDTFLEKMIKPVPECDKAIFRDPISGKELISSTLEAFRNGIAGSAFEMKIILRPWGFRLEDITFPIAIWHGEKDTQAPISHARLYQQLMPNATLNGFENDGHHSLIKNYFEQIIKTL